MELLLAAVGIGIITAGGLVVYVIVVCGKEKRRFRKEINMIAKREWDRVSKEWDEAPEEKELKQVISHKKEQIVTEKKSDYNERKKHSELENTYDEQVTKNKQHFCTPCTKGEISRTFGKFSVFVEQLQIKLLHFTAKTSKYGIKIISLRKIKPAYSAAFSSSSVSN